MEREGFFHRWSRLKAGGKEAVLPREAPIAQQGTVAAVGSAVPAGELDRSAQVPLPTLQDAAELTQQSDYSAFIAKGVDRAVQRLALKKLFADPHFNIMDGLDIYIGDYNRADPMPAAMLAALRHAQDFLEPAAGAEESGLDLPAAAIPTDAAADADAESAIARKTGQAQDMADTNFNQQHAAGAGSSNQPNSERPV